MESTNISKDDLDALKLLIREYEALSRDYYNMLHKQLEGYNRKTRRMLVFLYVWLAICAVYILLAVLDVLPLEYLYLLTAMNIGIATAQIVNNWS